jgi:hypothetical protein
VVGCVSIISLMLDVVASSFVSKSNYRARALLFSIKTNQIEACDAVIQVFSGLFKSERVVVGTMRAGQLSRGVKVVNTHPPAKALGNIFAPPKHSRSQIYAATTTRALYTTLQPTEPNTRVPVKYIQLFPLRAPRSPPHTSKGSFTPSAPPSGSLARARVPATSRGLSPQSPPIYSKHVCPPS